jgi:hypothetical protein
MKKKKHLGINLQAAKIAKMTQQTAQATTPNQLPETVIKAMPEAVKPIDADLNSTNNLPPVAPVVTAGQTASLQVIFRNIDAGLSDFTATCNGVSQTIHESDTISFGNVKTGDTILINGDSAGTTNVTIIGVNALPMQMSFVEGQHINGIFLIIP